MNCNPGKLRKALWWCAAVDQEVMLDRQCPPVDGIKYAVVGVLVCITTAVTTIGWMDVAALVLSGSAYRIPTSIALGVLMGSLVLTMERMLIVSIPAKVSLKGRAFAASWRGVLAGVTATIMTLPIALNYYHNDILNKLDDDKLLQMQQKRTAVDKVYGLTASAAKIDQLDSALAANRERRDVLPDSTKEIEAKLAACNVEKRKLENSLQPRISTASSEQNSIIFRLSLSDDAYLRRRITRLTADIERWRGMLAVKSRACASLYQQFEDAKKVYLAEVDDERSLLLSKRNERQTASVFAQQQAQLTLKKSDEVVVRHTAANLSAQLRALYQISVEDGFASVLLFVFWAFFWMVDIAPVGAKLISRSIYERLLGAREDKTAARINSEVVLAQAQASINEVIALAEKVAFESIALQNGSEVFKEYAESSARYRAAKAETLRPFELIASVADEFERSQSRINELEEGLQTTRDTAESMERVREMLREAMRRSPNVLRRVSAPPGERNDIEANRVMRGRMHA